MKTKYYAVMTDLMRNGRLQRKAVYVCARDTTEAVNEALMCAGQGAGVVDVEEVSEFEYMEAMT